METVLDIAECFAEQEHLPGNHWLAKVVLVAGTTCLTPSFPSTGTVASPFLPPPELSALGDPRLVSGLDDGPAELSAPGDLRFVSGLDDGPAGARPVTSPVEMHLQALIKHLSMPKSWIDEQVEPPTEDCKRYSFEVVRRLCATYGIIPYKITVSKGGAVFAAYRNPHNNRVLRIEVDNDLDVAAVVSDGQAIVDSGLLEGDDFERSLVGSFDRQLARAFSLPRAPGPFSF
jgi:hypothetical protein